MLFHNLWGCPQTVLHGLTIKVTWPSDPSHMWSALGKGIITPGLHTERSSKSHVCRWQFSFVHFYLPCYCSVVFFHKWFILNIFLVNKLSRITSSTGLFFNQFIWALRRVSRSGVEQQRGFILRLCCEHVRTNRLRKNKAAIQYTELLVNRLDGWLDGCKQIVCK